nr:MAG TPA: hypothetical protein [Bacteriophage sp.]
MEVHHNGRRLLLHNKAGGYVGLHRLSGLWR